MENPVRKQLNDFIGRRKITHPQFITNENMDSYFSSIGVDGQREIVHGLLRCSNLEKISDELRKKIVHLYNNLYVLKGPLKKRQTLIIVSGKKGPRKTAIIRLLDENNQLMKQIVEHLQDNSDETAQAIINWTISTVNLFGGVYLKYRCEIDGLKKIREQSVQLATQISEILSAAADTMASGKSPGGTGLFASKAKKEAQQVFDDKIAFLQQVIGNLGKTAKLVDAMREPIFLAQRVNSALQAAAKTVPPDWQNFYVSQIKDEKGMPVVGVTADHGLKSAMEKNYEKVFTADIQEVRKKLDDFKQLLPFTKDTALACGLDDEETLKRVLQSSRSLFSILNNLFLELQFAYETGLNRKAQILRDRKTYEIEKSRTDAVLETEFARTLEETFPTDFKDSKAALIEAIHKGITRDQHALLRSETNFWSMMKDRLFEEVKENRQSLFIRKRRMVN
ncbi:MAG: hypothetical protein ABIK68_16165, partial [bacterium]